MVLLVHTVFVNVFQVYHKLNKFHELSFSIVLDVGWSILFYGNSRHLAFLSDYRFLPHWDNFHKLSWIFILFLLVLELDFCLENTIRVLLLVHDCKPLHDDVNQFSGFLFNANKLRAWLVQGKSLFGTIFRYFLLKYEVVPIFDKAHENKILFGLSLISQ
jgi:hypothetical protein